MRMRAAFALLLLGVLPGPAAARPAPERALTIVGSRTTYVTITVAEETRYYLDRATARYAGGRWGGFLIGPDSSRLTDGRRDTLTLWTAYDDPTSRGQQSEALFQGFPARFVRYESKTGVLTPGRYRVYLFTDGQQVTVRLPWTAASRTVEPDAPVPARIESEQVVVPGGGAPTLLTMPLDGTARSLTEAAAVVDDGGRYANGVPAGGGVSWACYAPAATAVTHKTCYRGDRWDGYAAGGRDVGGYRIERLYGSAAGLQWRFSSSTAGPAVLTAVTVRYDP